MKTPLDFDVDAVGSGDMNKWWETALICLNDLGNKEMETCISTFSKILCTLVRQVAAVEHNLFGGDLMSRSRNPSNKFESCFEDELGALGRRIARVEQKFKTSGRLRVGDIVRIDGLDNVAHLHLNGKKAQLRRWEGPGGRWVVQVLQTSELKSLKVDNLRLVQHSPGTQDDQYGDPESPGDQTQDGHGGLCIGDIVEICKLRRTAQLNGSRAEIIAWDDDGGRWLVKMKSGLQKRLRAGNLRRVGEAVRLPSGIHKRAKASPAPLEAGMVVQICGLTGSGSHTLNGLYGVLQRWDAQACRWIVQLKESKEEKSLRPDNLLEAEGTVRAGQVGIVSGLEQAAHLNGKVAEVLRWQSDRGRWAVHIIDLDEEKSLRPESLTVCESGALIAGASVVISGLEQAEELNGLSAQLLSWSSSDSRWLIRIQDTGQERRLRPRRLLSHDRIADNRDKAQNGVAGSSAANAEFDDVFDDMSGESGQDSLRSDEEDNLEILREGMKVIIQDDSAHSGKQGTLVRWEDIGSPFGQWVVRLDPSRQEVRLPVASLTPSTSE